MNKQLLSTDIQDFINKNINTDVVSILLKKPIFDNVTNKEIVEQIQSKKKCKKKLPTWFKTPLIYFPKTLSIEQSSSEATAQYKSEIVDGKSLIDLTGGFGVDSYYFGQKMKSVVHCELDPELSQIAGHNYKVLGQPNIETLQVDGPNFLNENNAKWDWIYIDPSRRNDLKGKVFKLEDCLPNILPNLELLFQKSNKILLKTSPLLDLKMGISSLMFIKDIHIVAVDNEVKELLWILEKGFLKEPKIKAVNLKRHTREEFSFFLSEEKRKKPNLSMPLTYLYEPNSALMKSGAFATLAHKFNIHKLHQNTHLYTSEQLIEFPGRRFKIEKQLPYISKSIKNLALKKANISTRNFPETVIQLRKKYRIDDGGEIYLFFCKTSDEKNSMIKCHKVNNRPS